MQSIIFNYRGYQIEYHPDGEGAYMEYVVEFVPDGDRVKRHWFWLGTWKGLKPTLLHAILATESVLQFESPTKADKSNTLKICEDLRTVPINLH